MLGVIRTLLRIALVVIGLRLLTPLRSRFEAMNPELLWRKTALWMIRSIKEAITGVEEEFPVGFFTKCVGVVGAAIQRVVYRSAKHVRENPAQKIIQKAPFTIIL